MLNMSAVGNRNSTPVESNSTSSLRPPTSRTLSSGHHLRASADMTAFPTSPSANRIRPSSDFYGTQIVQGQGGLENDASDKIAQQWIADIDQYETTLEEMAAATLDQDFKDELSAIEQWFRVLSEAERTAALYALLQQTTQIQIRFFIQVLQQMGKNHPVSGVLSPANFDKDPMSNRHSDAMSRNNVDGSKNPMARPPPTPSGKRQFGLDASTINAMFPNAAAAIATEKAKFTQQTGNSASSNRNSAVYDSRVNLTAPSISGPNESTEITSSSPWASRGKDQSNGRPKSSSGQPPMGQFMQSHPSAGLRSPATQITNGANLQNTTILTAENHNGDMPLLSPYNGNGNWASMVSTPMVSSFNNAGSSTQADMVANATAMKLAALSTVNNRFALDDVKKYRRARSNDGQGQVQSSISAGLSNSKMPSANLIMVNEHGRVLTRDQVINMQAQQNSQFLGGRSRPNSPGLAMQGSGGFGPMQTSSPMNNGFLAARDGSSPAINTGLSNGMANMNLSMGQIAFRGHEGYLSDHSDMVRGRSPRGKRGSSKPPEDPTDPFLLQDIPSWLRSLRLHKYTENLKDMKWTELIELDDKALEDRGVNALGARRKMLKVFDQVKEARAEGKLS
ncbi:BgTH12-02813 [Blumeria graminis f. sp. triticale]|uniref:RNA-binding protein VTS1 n=3 Tax=Blumeria graminis TaxID=34373 RepID=A0A381LCG6_BLUGR|nr:hypothetical protein BGT96224_2257 [Blumeria graminis f. sp. tritici 96224]CAD6503144.1 BgTH12-02813 [Blumeria graminis f. sp. triticale]VDB89093.1 Bgt-2257 [Blumeria graminis f. sp. tritici]